MEKTPTQVEMDATLEHLKIQYPDLNDEMAKAWADEINKAEFNRFTHTEKSPELTEHIDDARQKYEEVLVGKKLEEEKALNENEELKNRKKTEEAVKAIQSLFSSGETPLFKLEEIKGHVRFITHHRELISVEDMDEIIALAYRAFVKYSMSPINTHFPIVMINTFDGLLNFSGSTEILLKNVIGNGSLSQAEAFSLAIRQQKATGYQGKSYYGHLNDLPGFEASLERGYMAALEKGDLLEAQKFKEAAKKKGIDLSGIEEAIRKNGGKGKAIESMDVLSANPNQLVFFNK